VKSYRAREQDRGASGPRRISERCSGIGATGTSRALAAWISVRFVSRCAAGTDPDLLAIPEVGVVIPRIVDEIGLLAIIRARFRNTNGLPSEHDKAER
jgi:hypothetical protein